MQGTKMYTRLIKLGILTEVFASFSPLDSDEVEKLVAEESPSFVVLRYGVNGIFGELTVFAMQAFIKLYNETLESMKTVSYQTLMEALGQYVGDYDVSVYTLDAEQLQYGVIDPLEKVGVEFIIEL